MWKPFATKAGADELREDVTARFRKLSSLSIVGDPGNADLILGGGGEIWIKGYRSFSPRSHMKMPTNGIPIHGGYLSVELKNRKGVTVWSYLATPDAASDNVSKDISKRIAKHLAEALTKSEIQTSALFQRPSIALAGAGATFPYRVYQKWFTNFQTEDPGTAITYDAIGSEAGIRKLLAGSIDFGASDSPEAIHELAPGDAQGKR